MSLSKDESESRVKLKNENNLVIQKADKGNTIVILDKDSYLKSVGTLSKDSSKFKNIAVAPNKNLNYITNSKKGVTDLSKKLKDKNVISEETYNKLRGHPQVHLVQDSGFFLLFSEPPPHLLLSGLSYKIFKSLILQHSI